MSCFSDLLQNYRLNTGKCPKAVHSYTLHMLEMWRGGTRKAVVVDYTKQPFRLYSQVLPQPTTWLLAKLQTLMLMHLLILWVRWCHLMVERTKTDSSLQAAAKLVLCPADEPPHALCSRSTCSFSAQGSPEQQAREKGNDWREKTAMKRYFGPLQEPEDAFTRNNCWKSPAVHAHHYHYWAFACICRDYRDSRDSSIPETSQGLLLPCIR